MSATTGEAIATLHNYHVGLTTELDDDQTRRLMRFLDILAGETGEKYTGSVIWGKVSETPVRDLNPIIITKKED